jgi:putative heme degradation protein
MLGDMTIRRMDNVGIVVDDDDVVSAQCTAASSRINARTSERLEQLRSLGYIK